jgi:hypothetical protein
VHKELTLGLLMSSLAGLSLAQSELLIPRSKPDKGKYYLLKKSVSGNITKTLHKRVGVSVIDFTLTEINCATKQYRVIGLGEETADSIQPISGNWTQAINGSSKSDLVNYVCNSK